MSHWAPGDTAVVIVVVAVLQTALLLWVVRGARRTADDTNRLLRTTHDLLTAFADEYRRQHRQATQFGTVVGLYRALRAGIESGTLAPEVRNVIYGAIEEAVEAHDRDDIR